MDGNWYTDLEAMPRLNRAARDWSQSYFQALNGYGFDATASFSMELGNGDPSAGAGIAQVYPDQSRRDRSALPRCKPISRPPAQLFGNRCIWTWPP